MFYRVFVYSFVASEDHLLPGIDLKLYRHPFNVYKDVQSVERALLSARIPRVLRFGQYLKRVADTTTQETRKGVLCKVYSRLFGSSKSSVTDPTN